MSTPLQEAIAELETLEERMARQMQNANKAMSLAGNDDQQIGSQLANAIATNAFFSARAALQLLRQVKN